MDRRSRRRRGPFTSAGDVTFKPQLVRLYYTGVGIQMCGNSATPIAATVRVT